MDWRFLSPDAGLGVVAVLGDVSSTLREGLAEVSSKVVDEPRPRHEQGPVHTAVLGRRPRAHVAKLGDLGPDLRAVWVPSASRRSRRSLVAALRKAGFDATSVHWARPNLERPTLFVHLDDRIAAAAVLRLLRSGTKASVEAFLARSGLAACLGGAVSVLALRGGCDAEAVAAPGDGRPTAALITPRFGTSRAVVGVSVGADGHLAAVAKVPRSIEGEVQLAHEAEALAAFDASAGAPSVPSHRLERRAGRLVLTEPAASGRPLDPASVRADRRTALRAGMEWLDAVPVDAATPPDVDGRRQALIDSAAATLGGSAPGSTHPRARAIERTLRFLAPLGDAPVPMVFEHGDLSHPNLFLGDDGRLEVIDWERAVIRGLPLHDAFFFCGYLASAVERPRRGGELVDAYLRAVGPHGWARGALERHAERVGIDPRHLGLYEVAAWFRATATLVRAGAGRGTTHRRAETIWMARLVDLGEGRR